ncbi:N-6 DNA methylase [Rathayibacter sp. KR2-224]|uniref:N-6 DNA methylase n=1 Tax=Rathayibacter sp. KR2-224 TaxID=3400913 RepID=UPI003BFBAA99
MRAETPDESTRKKQLGQYFTGRPVGRLLAALADAESALSIIDPMVGSADLLAACLEVGARPESMVGYDLDPQAIEQASVVMAGEPGVSLEAVDAFSAVLPGGQFDLVITNPPYIRYQSKGYVDGLTIPSAATVRSRLVRSLQNRAALGDEAQAAFLRAAHAYPGTADIAVPAWVLSAALVREGGVLAVVAPQAWLNRNYAHAVRELLDLAFDVEVVVEDGDASWFEDALVRTQLVVARRRSVGPRTGHSIVVGRATRELETRGSLLGARKSEQAVARALRKVASPQPVTVTRGLTARVSQEISLSATGERSALAPRVALAVGQSAVSMRLRTIEAYGWRVGQGLRTGANDFFYLAEIDGAARPATRWGLAMLDVPTECLEIAVRRQSDLGDELDVSETSALSARVLNLRGWVTQADAKRVGDPAPAVLSAKVSAWIDRVARTPLVDSDPTKTFPELAAVATNAKHDRRGQQVGFWYQLPPMAPRHRPALFMPRVCGGRPFAYSNSAGALVDANFATMWQESKDAIPASAMSALLNSAWAWANAEVSSTVLGGGALKVEATDLRRLPLPDLDSKTVEGLAALGAQLRSRRDQELLERIDLAVAGAIVGKRASHDVADALRATAKAALEGRTRS